MAEFDYASFKNSRVYGRKATTTGSTNDLTVNSNAGPVTLVRPANDNRTYLTIRNLHATDALKYLYNAAGSPAPAIADILNDGFTLKAGESVDLESLENLYALSTTANPVLINYDEGQG